jgi:glycosyltransferase involved in cell wall biosynthesis
MDSLPLISVVIPCYNDAEYLDECLHSVAKQTYQALEVIIVDDGSSDGSHTICDDWVGRDPRYKVIHKSNQGPNRARQDGYLASSGEYITFLDADDMLSPTNIANSLQVMLESDADIVMYEWAQFVGDVKPLPVIGDARQVIDSKEEAFWLLIVNPHQDRYAVMTIHCKLYKRAVVEHVDWDLCDYRNHEDIFWMPQAFNATGRLVVIDQQLYIRRLYDAASPLPLSRQLTGNSFKGSPVGYLEVTHHWYTFLEGIITANQLDLMDVLSDKRFGLLRWKLDTLIELGLMYSENNLDYVADIYVELRRRTDYTIASLERALGDKQRQIEELSEWIRWLRSLKGSLRAFGRALLTKLGLIRKDV